MEGHILLKDAILLERGKTRIIQILMLIGGRRILYASKEKVTMLRVARLMRQAACILTASAVLTLVQAAHQLALTKDWTKVFDALGCVDDVTISYWLLVAASAFDAISSTKNKDVVQPQRPYTLTSTASRLERY